jgi:hypothetical protein
MARVYLHDGQGVGFQPILTLAEYAKAAANPLKTFKLHEDDHQEPAFGGSRQELSHLVGGTFSFLVTPVLQASSHSTDRSAHLAHTRCVPEIDYP